jgi:hypothetical protein
MTLIERPPSASDATQLVPVLPDTRWDRVEALLERASDRLNPILVKEARQALRSRQFIITFFLMLAAGWVWSILGLASIGPAVYYAAEGPQMLFVYHMILSFPLLVVAPYSAFYSLSAERQDRTYELVSITALGARQILSGKLGGIALQMMVYLSAIFPCLAFTYLLRGLDIFTIVMGVIYTCALSLALSVTGLLLAAIAPLRQRHIALSVFFALVLFGALFADNSWTSGIVYFMGLSVESSEFWLIQGILLTLFLNYFAIVFLAARSQLTTASENRSTALRWALVVAQLCFVAWMTWAAMTWGGDFVFGLVYFSTVFWYVTGIFMTGEPSALSPRVQRDLPQSTLGRWFLTWFTPGPATGYMFAISNLLAVVLLACLPYDSIAVAFGASRPVVAATPAAAAATIAVGRPAGPAAWNVFGAGVVALSYLVIYLGLGAIILRAVRRFADVRLAMPVVIHVCLLLLGSGTPWVIQMTSLRMRNMGWTLLEITNPVWTLAEVCFKRLPFDMPVLILALPTAALLVWLLNLPSLLDALRQVRIPKPLRVEEEDAARAALFAGAAAPKSPWDDEGA